jgi:GNAT superfamily N-acetyltransferase
VTGSPRLIALVAALALLLAIPAVARADGDPASDVLLAQDVFFPYAPATAPRLGNALTALLARTRESGYPMKVALIESEGDLGANADLFGRPLEYANLLAEELRTLRHGRAGGEELHLLVVMPTGFSGWGLGDRVNEALEPVRIDAAAQSDGLARAAIEAVARLASVNGHRSRIPPEAKLALAPRHESTKPPGASVLPFVLPFAVVTIAIAVVALAAARRQHRVERSP